jgi:hypothetical protein
LGVVRFEALAWPNHPLQQTAAASSAFWEFAGLVAAAAAELYHSAATLMEGVFKMVFLTKFKPVFWTAGLVLASAGILQWRSLAADRPAGDQAAALEKEQAATDRLTVAEFDRLHKKLTKMSTEKVWSIPWQLSIREARELAAKENQPVFLWISSNGGTHPLGPC